MAGVHGVLEFEDLEGETSELATKTVHELRRTRKGRKKLVEDGRSMLGYKRGQGVYSSVPFPERRFVSWDGEGGTTIEGPSCEKCNHITCVLIRYYRTTDQSKSYYVLFGNSDGDSVQGPDLSTIECLSLIIDKAHIDAIHFGFAFTYDVNMILKDLSKNHLRALKDNGHITWKRWRIEFLPRKWFLVTDTLTHRTVRIWDVWTYFMTSAIKAWREYGVPVSQAVIDGKDARGNNSYLDIAEMYQYWKEENDAYVCLMDKLRESLHSADLFISAWHGPGAIASYSMQKHHIDKAMCEPPEQVGLASQYAYGGGRFELFKVGRANTKVYEYDVNSAYPFAIAQLPNLARGRWVYRSFEECSALTRIPRFATFHVALKLNPFESNHNLRAMPFLNRDHHGLISFPCVNETWVWSPELQGKQNFPGLTILEGWEFIEDDESDRPFAWLAENYHIRKLYKAAGNQAQYALKLQMNSMYGKTAQRVGWNEKNRTAPKWHQLEWAGWVTSYCRSMVFRAALYAGSGLVSFETDAVFTTTRLSENLDIGSGLGQWEETIFDDFVYLQSGCRFGLLDGKWEEKYRGFDKGSITLEDTLTAFSKDPSEWFVRGKTSRFIGFGQALHTKFETWRQFQTDQDRVMHMGGEGKRRHVPRLCMACRNGQPATTTFHDCVLAVPAAGMSHKHPLPWKEPIDLTQQLADEQKYEQPFLDGFE